MCVWSFRIFTSHLADPSTDSLATEPSVSVTMIPQHMAAKLASMNKKAKHSNSMDTDTTPAYSDPMSVSSDHTAYPATLKTLMGTTVGLLDDTQKVRLLSSPTSVLSFATWHHLTATGRREGARADEKLSSQSQLKREARIVIETLETGETFWRWVPRARGMDTAQNEGPFPRRVVVCG